MDLCLGWIRRSRGNPACCLQACAGIRQPQLQQAGKLSTKRDGFADLLCYVAGFRQWGEEEDSQISGLAKRASPTGAFLTGQRYKNDLVQRDSIGFKEYRKIQRSVPCWEGGRGSEEELLRCLEDAEGSAEDV